MIYNSGTDADTSTKFHKSAVCFILKQDITYYHMHLGLEITDVQLTFILINCILEENCKLLPKCLLLRTDI